jgi:hypothetical protein
MGLDEIIGLIGGSESHYIIVLVALLGLAGRNRLHSASTPFSLRSSFLRGVLRSYTFLGLTISSTACLNRLRTLGPVIHRKNTVPFTSTMQDFLPAPKGSSNFGRIELRVIARY